ncbi:MAG: MDR/zinc-dependent alcohol dehydrogenase-like family protein [Thermodesulfobacteriota bacterium]
MTDMKAAVFEGPKTIRIRQVPMPVPGPDQVRVRLEGCGLCASNLPVWEGRDWFEYPFDPGAPGHEGWGRIDRVGKNVSRFQVGDRVAMISAKAYAEYDTADADTVVPLPEKLNQQLFPGEPLGCAMNIFRRSGIEAEQVVGIVGIGFLGAMLTKLATGAGAKVIAVSRRPFSLSVARECGAAEALSMEDSDKALNRVMELTREKGCDRVIEAVGMQETLDLASRMVRVRGRLIIAGYHQDGLRTVDMQSWNWRGLDVINAHERDPAVYCRGIREAAEAVSQKKIDPAPLFTHSFPLDRIGEAFETLSKRPEGFIKAVVCF